RIRLDRHAITIDTQMETIGTGNSRVTDLDKIHADGLQRLIGDTMWLETRIHKISLKVVVVVEIAHGGAIQQTPRRKSGKSFSHHDLIPAKHGYQTRQRVLLFLKRLTNVTLDQFGASLCSHEVATCLRCAVLTIFFQDKIDIRIGCEHENDV